MRGRELCSISFIAGAAFMLVFGVCPSAVHGQRYVATVLPLSEATDIDNFGTVVGSAGYSGPAVAWDQGTIIQMSEPGGIVYSKAYGINDVGQVAVNVGYHLPPYYVSPFRAGMWDLNTGALTVFGTLGGRDSYGFAINDLGQVAGGACPAPTDYRGVPCLFVGAEVQALNVPPGPNGIHGSAIDINNSGQVIGTVGDAGFLWQNGSSQSLPSSLRDINDAGQVVGGAGSAWVWDGGNMRYLPSLGPFEVEHFDAESGESWTEMVESSSAYGINNSGQITGCSLVEEGWQVQTHGVLWQGDDIVDLNTCVIARAPVPAYFPSGEDWVMRNAMAVNDRGQILGEGELRDAIWCTFPILLSPAVIPDIIGPGRFRFVQVRSGDWFDPPWADGFTYTMTDGSLFTKIICFPAGLGDFFIVTTEEATFLAEPGMQLDLGEGVSEFTITGIDPPVDAADPTCFPLQLEFNNPTASFEMQAIPEPATLALLALGGLAVLYRRRR